MELTAPDGPHGARQEEPGSEEGEEAAYREIYGDIQPTQANPGQPRPVERRQRLTGMLSAQGEAVVPGRAALLWRQRGEGGALYDPERLSSRAPGNGQQALGGGATRGPRGPEDTERPARDQGEDRVRQGSAGGCPGRFQRVGDDKWVSPADASGMEPRASSRPHLMALGANIPQQPRAKYSVERCINALGGRRSSAGPWLGHEAKKQDSHLNAMRYGPMPASSSSPHG
ncbi:hypothetical protein G7Z17_g10146 [Cylindrodendrum hubeiense]|uniref:Uncharacterized protein n=1 Tax=Cylindrodendrum hubeiense TaxID=595255 RepID=A0A9P5H023_9HYPO|nr:hypothetical protein G7Z17_g10146 [Cylindrodendrum hubeiense]